MWATHNPYLMYGLEPSHRHAQAPMVDGRMRGYLLVVWAAIWALKVSWSIERDNNVYHVAHPHCRAHCGVLTVISLDASAALDFTGRSFDVLIVRVLC